MPDSRLKTLANKLRAAVAKLPAALGPAYQWGIRHKALACAVLAAVPQALGAPSWMAAIGIICAALSSGLRGNAENS